MSEKAFTLRQVGAATVAELGRESMSDSCEEVHDSLHAGIVDGTIRQLWLDFDRVEYLPDRGIAVCLTLLRRLQEAGGVLILCRVPPRVMEFFEITRTNLVLDLRRDVIRDPIPGDPHERAFLLDMQANPDDDAPRLIFADWLDEHDNPARAEFIRVQCRRAQLAETSPEQEPLRQDEQELLVRHGATWLAPIAYLLRDCTFRRGFVEQVEVSPQTVPDDLATLFDRTPLTSLRFVGWARRRHEQLIDRLVALPEITRLRELLLPNLALDDTCVMRLAASPNLVNLRTLDLSRNDLGEPGFEALLTSPNLSNLRTLSVIFRDDIGEPMREALRERFGVGLVEK